MRINRGQKVCTRGGSGQQHLRQREYYFQRARVLFWTVLWMGGWWLTLMAQVLAHAWRDVRDVRACGHARVCIV